MTALNKEGVEAASLVGHPDDECECGDARRSHIAGVGKCAFNRNGGGVGHHGAPDCDKFRLAFPHAGPGSRADYAAIRSLQSEGGKP